MQAEMYEISSCPVGRLATMPRPRGGQWLKAEIASLKARGVTDLVTMLTPAEEVELGLQAEAQFCAEFGIRLHRHVVSDRGIPSQPGFNQFIASIVSDLHLESFVAIHCRAGIGRSSVAAAGILCGLGVPAPAAIGLISEARGFEVPDTDEQFEFIMSLDSREDQ